MLPVTIGIPAYNEEKFIAETVKSALVQPVSNIVISDNGSTDNTVAICKKIAAHDKRIKILEQGENKGPKENITACLMETQAPYFIFIGAHDIIMKNHIVRLLDAIKSSKGAVYAYADAVYIDETNTIVGNYKYSYAPSLMSPSPLTRLFSLIKNLSDGTIMHGLCEREILVELRHDPDFIPCDIFTLGHLALLGKLVHVPDSPYVRRASRPGETTQQKRNRYAERYQKVDEYFLKLPEGAIDLFALAVLRHMTLLDKMYPEIRYRRK